MTIQTVDSLFGYFTYFPTDGLFKICERELKIMRHVRQPVYTIYTHISPPACWRTGLRLNRSETSRNFPRRLSRSVRQHPLPRPVSSSAQLRSTENRGRNPGQDILVSFRKFLFPFVFRRVFLLFIARFVEGCTRTKARRYFFPRVKFFSLFRIKGKMPRLEKIISSFFF